MKCPMCDGKGIRCEESDNGIGYISCECYHCNGTGEIELTEQEWLQTATMEQLADKLTDFSFWLVVELPTNERREKVRKRIVEWLKQPHQKE